jgi:hypothetical protein
MKKMAALAGTFLLAGTGCLGSSDSPLFADASLANQPAEDGGIGDAAPSGPARLELSSKTIAFGEVDCGGVASDKTLTLRNAGAEPLTWEVSLDSSEQFSMGGTSSGSLEPGATVDISVKASAVAANAKAGALVQTGLNVVTNDRANGRVVVPVTLTPAGAELALLPASADFGTYPVAAQAPDVPVALANTGNKSVSVTFVQPADSQFSIEWTSSPAAVELKPGATVVGLLARFKPATTVPSSSQAQITTTGVVCGTSAKQIALTGQGTNGVVGVTPASLDFGSVDCGSQAGGKTVTVSNTGNGAFKFDATLDAAGAQYYAVSPASGSVAPGSSAALTIVPKAVPAVSPVTANFYAGGLVVKTNAVGDAPHSVSLAQTARGAIVTVSKTTLGFNSVPVATTQSGTVAITNAGNVSAPLTVTASGTGFSVSPSGALTIAAGDSVSATARFSPTTAGAATGALKVVAGSVALCAPMPADVALSGTGTSGQVSLSAQSFDFGATNCGSSATARTLSLQNPGNASYTWTAKLSKGASSPYALNKASGSVAASGSDSLVITPSAIPSTSAVPGNFADSLVITTNVPGDAAHTIALSQSAQGAILRFSPATAIAFGQVPLGSTSSASFSVVNDGNLSANVVVASSQATVTLSPSAASIAGQASASVTSVFRPTDTTAKTGTIALSPTLTTGVLCAPLPTALSFTGTGTKGVASVSPAQISFGESGFANCGTQAATQTVTVRNDGNASFIVTNVTLPTGYAYTAPNGLTVAANGSISLVVTPPAVPARLDAVTAYGGTMAITTNITGDTAHNVALSLTSRGAILARSPGSNTISFSATAWPGSSTSSVAFTNMGNATANLDLAISGAAFSGPSSATVSTTGATSTFTYTPQASGAEAGTVTVSAAAGSPMCSDVPASFALSGTGLAGVLSFSSSPVDFGKVNCGAQGEKTFTVSNSGNADIANVYAVFSTGGLFGQKGLPDSAATATTLKAGASATVTVWIGTTKFGSSSDKLGVLGDLPGGGSGVELTMMQTGALVTVTPTAMTISAPMGDTVSQEFKLTNTGDQAFPITGSFGSVSSYFGDSFKPVTLSANGGTGGGSLNYIGRVNDAITYNFQQGVSPTDIPLCAPLPSIAVTGVTTH